MRISHVTLHHLTSRFLSTNLDFLAINVQSSNSKIHSYSVLLLFKKYPCLKTVDHTSLAHVSISYEDDLEEEITGVLLQLHLCGL